MLINEIKTPLDILNFMKDNIRYGWLDINNMEHVNNLKNFRKLYRTSSLEATLKHKMGTCIEQVYLMSKLLDRIGIDNKMFCTRVYEGDDFNNLEEEEHMHCFVLYYLNGKVYHLEYPNFEKIGIYEYESEELAIKEINDYYVKMAKGRSRPVTEFYDVAPGLSFKEFNQYINSLDDYKKIMYNEYRKDDCVMNERMKKEELMFLLNNLKIDKEEFWVLSSGALLLRGIYEDAGDLDIAVTDKGLEQLKSNYDLVLKDNGWYIVNDKIECVCDGDKANLKYQPELLEGGYYVQNIHDYLDYLKSSKREKDILRIPLVKKYIKGNR